MGCRTALLYICLALHLVGEQAQASKDHREEAGSADLLSPRQYEHLQRQLGAVRDVSRRYWHLLACQLWQEGCEEEEEGRTQREEEEEGSRGILEQHGRVPGIFFLPGASFISHSRMAADFTLAAFSSQNSYSGLYGREDAEGSVLLFNADFNPISEYILNVVLQLKRA